MVGPHGARILEMLLDGAPQMDIARRLALSRRTVANYRSALIQEHGAPSTAAMVAGIWAGRCRALEAENARLRASLAAIDRRRAVEDEGVPPRG